ncbi:hypothetical protein B0H14DRAFT_3491905 [Mycena olivaceomarginata]|nr:hypothetical protein B0H14DRAFT_3491905 [Mycena olivaceomarginata]
MQVMTLHNTSTPLDAFLDPAKLTAAVQAMFTVYWASYADHNMRIPINSSDGYLGQSPVTIAQIIGSQTRIVQATVPTRLLQGLFSLILMCGVLTAIAVPKANHVLKKPPYSIGASMSLLVDSTLLELEELRWVANDTGIDNLLDKYKVQLGWGNNPFGGIRFGVDVVAE